MTILSNFQPRRRQISAVTQAVNGLITTTTDHGYVKGQILRILISSAHGMTVEYVKVTVVTVPADDQFTVDLDTSVLAPFVVPTAPPAFTQA